MKHHRIRSVALAGVALSLLWAGSVQARAVPDRFCDAVSAQIMILGTYHMANPGLDENNLQADDVLTPRRQGEIEEVTARLERFRPTKIMVEAPRASPATQRDYLAYLSGRRQLTRNEVEQLGFRLGKAMDLPQIYPIDYEMRMSGLRPDEIDDGASAQTRTQTQTAGQTREPTQAASPARARSDEEERLARQTIREFLLNLNDPDRAAEDNARSYMGALVPDDSPALYAGADRLTHWHQRNFRMFSNIIRGTTPGDRVLVIVGAGHLHILRNLALDAPYYCLVEPSSVLS